MIGVYGGTGSRVATSGEAFSTSQQRVAIISLHLVKSHHGKRLARIVRITVYFRNPRYKRATLESALLGQSTWRVNDARERALKALYHHHFLTCHSS
jgi:hypothetical protein